MHKIILTLIAAISLIAFGSAVAWEPVIPIPQPEFAKIFFRPGNRGDEYDFAIPGPDRRFGRLG